MNHSPQLHQLLQHWEKIARSQKNDKQYCVKLPVEVAAKLQALAELYPKRPLEHLMTDLIIAAVRDLEQSFPYIKGNDVVAQDELGDPIYNDAGITPEFLALTKKHLHDLKGITPRR